MGSNNGKGATLVAPLILLAVGCVCIGYDLAKIVNELEGTGTLVTVGVVSVGVALLLIVRGASAKAE